MHHFLTFVLCAKDPFLRNCTVVLIYDEHPQAFLDDYKSIPVENISSFQREDHEVQGITD